MSNFQRAGAISNAHVGRAFEKAVLHFFKSQGLELKEGHAVSIGLCDRPVPHKFDLGTDNPKIIVECKSHKWTESNKTPSAKLSVWNEAMYYFTLAPDDYRKLFVVLRDTHKITGETLANYYVRVKMHLIPEAVEIWEYDPETMSAFCLKTAS